jgi:small conductance mechanosensitive channel
MAIGRKEKRMDRFWVVPTPTRENKAGKRRSTSSCSGWFAGLISGLVLLLLLAGQAGIPTPAVAQGGAQATPTPAGDGTPLEAPERVEIRPTARDEEIRGRLQSILVATGWFTNPEVQVRDGVVFLEGQTRTEEYKRWAGDLARNTQDVAAVVNQIELITPSVWDFQPALTGLREIWFSLVRSIPLVGFSLLILLVAGAVARLSFWAARVSLSRRFSTPLLRNVVATTIGVFVFLAGLYVVFQVAGLTSVALTVMGGTGLIGLILGIAFRDITENFLASIFLSIQRPFHTGDQVEIAGILGFVQSLTTRVTVLMTPDGNHVQIPNSTVYKSNIYNYTSNPNRRIDFGIGIGFEDSITDSQKVALKVLAEHPAVLKDPEPWVLVDNLGSATVNLRIYFWVDGTQHSWVKVKSSVIRLVKRAYQAADISMPDDAREMFFPKGVSVRLMEPDGEKQPGSARAEPAQAAHEPASVSTDAEAGLSSEARKIQEQAHQSRKPEEGENLLEET